MTISFQRARVRTSGRKKIEDVRSICEGGLGPFPRTGSALCAQLELLFENGVASIKRACRAIPSSALRPSFSFDTRKETQRNAVPSRSGSNGHDAAPAPVQICD